MNSKWRISLFFLLLFAVFGALQERTTLPNQEIVLEFVNDFNTENQEKTVANLKEKLVALGVSNIKINKTEKGILKISYYSISDVKQVENELSKNENLLVESDKNHHPKENKNDSYYNLDIYEIEDVVDLSTSTNDCVIEIKLDYKRFTNTNFLVAFKSSEIGKKSGLFNSKLKANQHVVFNTKTVVNGEPEVRAGPSLT